MSRRILAFVFLAVLALGGIVVVNLRVGPDAPVSGQLAPYLERARDMARSSMGLAGLVPVRLVEARCSEDGRAAVLTFESGLASIRSYASIGFPPAEEWSAPGAVIGIVGASQPESDPTTLVSCDLVEIGPPG